MVVMMNVDYEMAGKDLVTAADISAKITQTLGGRSPAGFRYEMFLDEKGLEKCAVWTLFTAVFHWRVETK